MTLSALPSASGSAYMSPWRRLDAMPAASSLTRARRSISDERSMPIACARARAEQLDHPPGAGADIDQPAERRAAERPVDRPLDLAFGDMKRADLVPHLGMRGEIAVGGFGALGADRLGARGVGCEQARGSRASAQQSISANIGSTRSGSARRGTPSCLPCAVRALRRRRGSSSGAKPAAGFGRAPAPARRPTTPSIRSSASIRSRVGSASAWKRSASGRAAVTEIRI